MARWNEQMTIKHLLTDDDNVPPEQVKAIATAIAGKLRKSKLFDDEEVITNLEGVDDMHEFNSILDDMYDECDRVGLLVL